MNRYDFTQPDGFPFDQGVLNFLQECIRIASQGATLAGPLAILSGCEVVGPHMSDGLVYINGEILPFTGGNLQPKIIINEVATPVVFQNGAPKVVKYVRTAMFGDDGTDNYPYGQFKRNTTEGILARLDRCEALLAPLRVDNGTMLLWRKPSTEPLPTGWQEVVDWRGRIAMGHTPETDGREVGDILGKEGHVMTLANLIEHDHDYTKPANNGSASGNAVSHPDGPLINAKTGKSGNAYPEAIPTLPPVRIIMYIEPIPGTFNIA